MARLAVDSWWIFDFWVWILDLENTASNYPPLPLPPTPPNDSRPPHPPARRNQPLRGWLLWFGGWWMVAVVNQLVNESASQRSPSLLSSLFSLLLILAPIYFLTLGRTVGAADAFKFKSLCPNWALFLPGLPLYLLLEQGGHCSVPFGQLAFHT
ncbi:MAG: hypothetical protein IPL28_22815 [Chloroflexi bacterium]|nr:hypothetical protein [Chloroflexota bacterium]